MSPTIAPPERHRGRLQLIGLIAVVVGPMLLATAMYRFGFWIPENRSYHGVLVGGQYGRAELGVPERDRQGWELLVTAPGDCAADCRELVYLARQINIGLGREADRAGHALASATALPADFEAQLTREYPQLARYRLDRLHYEANPSLPTAPQLWIVDPHGNLVLRYGSGVQGKAILEDLRHLLKISRIG
ncbi:hypothetical protein [Stutzerimonas azotifigens]|uniref:hypothetical protein n=1 Tax=Stutzerimonas azotifigens TaxID=291995 RepID=UPI000481BF97|nr:hypothetical protein [Stutzerimonas azotifigens]